MTFCFVCETYYMLILKHCWWDTNQYPMYLRRIIILQGFMWKCFLHGYHAILPVILVYTKRYVTFSSIIVKWYGFGFEYFPSYFDRHRGNITAPLKIYLAKRTLMKNGCFYIQIFTLFLSKLHTNINIFHKMFSVNYYWKIRQ